jgi:arsenite methyltransferase
MDDPEQVAAYVEAGRINAVAVASLFHSARVTQVIQAAVRCGPGLWTATQLAQIAELDPDIRFTGLDFSPTMLADAEKHVQALGLGNVSSRQGDTRALDGIISTMACTISRPYGIWSTASRQSGAC